MSSYNYVSLLGNVGKEPETRKTQSNKSMTRFSLATSSYNDGKEVTQWHNIVAYDMDNVIAYIHKGTKVMIVGRIEYRSYQGSDNQTKFITEIIASRIILLGKDGQQEQPTPQHEQEQVPQSPTENDQEGALPF